MSLSTINIQLSLRGVKTITAGAGVAKQPLDPANIIRLLEGTGSGQVDELSNVEELVVGPTNEKQTITVSATGGTFTVDDAGGSGPTAALAFDIGAAALETALEGLPGIGAGNVSVSGGPGDELGSAPYVIEFISGLAATDVGSLVTDPALLTGGSMTANVATTRVGAAGAPTDLDLTAITDGFDDPQDFARIKAILIRNMNTEDGEILTVGGSGPANPWQGFGNERIVYPGADASSPGLDLWVAPRNDTDTIVDATNKVLRLESAKNRISAEIYLIGIKS